MGCVQNKNSAEAKLNQRPNLQPNSEKEGKLFEQAGQAKTVQGVSVNTSKFVNFIQEPVGKHYETRRKLGDGSFGVVSEVRHKATGDIRAMKKITKKYIERSSKAQNEFNSEINILRNLKHPNIIKMYEFYEDSRYISLITELCTGGELFDYIVNNQCISEPLSADIFQQLLTAVHYLHSNGVVHRDLKPENLILESAPRRNEKAVIKVIDFGTGVMKEAGSTYKEMAGSVTYMAPEVVSKNYDYRCDIWSCGVILYVMLSGCPPFQGQTDQATMGQIVKQAVDFPRNEWRKISAEAKDLVTKMLEKSPNRRISLTAALQHPWIKRYCNQPLEANEQNVDSLSNLRRFNAESKLQQAVTSMIISQLTSVEDTKEIRKAFIAIDENSDGKLSKDEIKESYCKVFGEDLSQEELDDIWRRADSDNSGFIDYDEFIAATMSKEKHLCLEKIKTAFDILDTDQSGTLSLEEIKKGIGEDLANEQVWLQIVAEADQDGNGVIDLEEFQTFMQKI